MDNLELEYEHVDVDLSIPAHDIARLLKLVSDNNIFEFNEEHPLQILGTAMGTRLAPSYANIFMEKLERNIYRCNDQFV